MSYLLTVTCIVLSWGPLWNVELPTYKCFENSPAHFILVPSFRSLQFTISRSLLSDFNPAKVVLIFLQGEAKKVLNLFYWRFIPSERTRERERVCVLSPSKLALASYNGMQGYENWMELACQASCTLVSESMQEGEWVCVWACVRVQEIEIRLTEENRRASVGAPSTNYDPFALGHRHSHTLAHTFAWLYVWTSSAC